jgi:hypothetical protein
MNAALRRLGFGLLGFLLIVGFGAATQITSYTVTIKASRLYKNTVDFEIKPALLNIPFGSTVIFQNHPASVAPIQVINATTELFKEIQPGAQYSHIFKNAGELLITINAASDSTLYKISVGAAAAILAPSGAKPILAMAEILLDPFSGEQLVALANWGKSAASLSNWHLCLGPICTRLDNTTIAPQSWIVLHLGITAPNTPTDMYVALPKLNKSNDELALYSSDRTDNPLNMVDYVRWGNGHAPSSIGAAVSAGLWASGASLDVSRLVRGQVIRYDGVGRRISDYALSVPTMLGSIIR